MLKILVKKWDKNKDKLKHELETRRDIKSIEYRDLVKITFGAIFNSDAEEYDERLNLERITEIDDGDYQGTFLFLIPFDTYQPSANEYLMTYVGYGSCSGCDALLNIFEGDYGATPCTEEQVRDLMLLCKDIITNTTKPYNNGWRKYENYDHIEEE